MFRFTIWTSANRESRKLVETIHSAVQSGEIPDSRISAVVCNRIKGEASEVNEFIDMCRGAGLFVISISSEKVKSSFQTRELATGPFTWREEIGRRFRLHLTRMHSREMGGPQLNEIHLLVGYMLWVDDITARELRMLNLHPALPGGPVGTWQQVITAIQTQGAREHGATIQRVRSGKENRDRGDPVAFFRFPVTPGMSFDEIRAEGFRREPVLLIETLKGLAQGQFHLGEGAGSDITEVVEAKLAASPPGDGQA